MMKVYGPYTRKDGRKHVILYENGHRTTVSYPKYLMELHLGRKLEEWETVDHIDEDFTNDAIENLQILSRGDNARKSIKPPETITFDCPECEKKITKSAAQIRHNQDILKKSGPFCSRMCAGKYQHKQEVKNRKEMLKAVGL